MSEWEVSNVLEVLDHADRNLWECIRLNTYVLAQVNSKKKLKSTDIVKLPWDRVNKSTGETNITNSDIERLKNKAQYIKQNLI